jgi:D-aminoacyl-tRNA deacylase
MRFAIAYSKKDIAGTNIVEQLKKICFLPQFPIIELSKETLYSDDLNEKNYPQLKNIDFVIFASRHKSEKAEKTLSLHAPGNFRTADFGGKLGKLNSTSAFVLKYLFQELNKNAKEINEIYSVTLECTHHGPLIEIPCCFIEVGATENEWNDEKATRVIAKTILSLQYFDKAKTSDWIPVVGIGGPHYCPNFNKIQLESEYAISHIVPKYALPLTETFAQELEKKTIENLKFVLLDWKGIGDAEEREKTLQVLKHFNFNFKKISEIKP